ncbi:PucR family transcriptional regulator [Embleya hyalina]|uniref:PucR family transcriptional regulator n=1 Tax=Embleya hyalina TaxID=516124 RepID=A0A401YQN1_9ACTN|nr:PucR family transcriptional regulator [Embleya hyalina]GCD96893.1 hypothetical protein EHYA_04580 [Embleya hyalina]
MFTMRALVEARELRLVVLVPGPPGALDADVDWVHNTELSDPSPYVGPGELVMTNGLWSQGTPAVDFVANLVRARAAGVVFGLRDSVRRTPPDLVDACRAADLPLLELAVEVPFTALSHAAAAAYARRRQGTLEASVRRADALTDVISGGGGTAGALRVIRRELDLPLAVVDRAGRALAQVGVRLAEHERTTVAVALTRRPPPLEVPIGSERGATLFPIGGFGAPAAALVCFRPPAHLGEFEQGALQQAAHFLSLEIARRRAEQAIENRFAGELVDMILSGMGAPHELTHRLEAFGVDARAPLAVCALARRGTDGDQQDLADAAAEAFASDGVPAVLAPGSRDIVGILVWRTPETELGAWFDRFAARLEEAGSGPVILGFSSVAAGSSQLRTSLVEARQACRILMRQPSGPRVASFAELPSYAALLGRLDAPTLRRMADGLLGPLREQDAARNTHLEPTLRVFLDQDAQFAATAEILFVHVNTLRKRLARIRDLTGRDPLLTEGRVDLFLALQADMMTGP